MATPPVSVILPTRNRAEMLGGALDSIAAQQVAGVEVLVVDDGSTDRTAQVVAAHRLRPRYFRQESRGVAAARNNALAHAQAPLVAFLDDDDRWRAGFLPAVLDLFERRTNLVLAYSDFESVDPLGEPLARHRKHPREGRITQPLFQSIFIHTSCVVAARQPIADGGGFDETLICSEDYDLWLRLSLQGEFALLAERLVERTVHPGSLSRSDLPAKLRCKAEMLERFYRGPGADRLDAAAARRRLGKVFYSAGKAAVKGRDPGAAAMLARSWQYGHARVKLLAWMLAARVMPASSSAASC